MISARVVEPWPAHASLSQQRLVPGQRKTIILDISTGGLILIKRFDPSASQRLAHRLFMGDFPSLAMS